MTFNHEKTFQKIRTPESKFVRDKEGICTLNEVNCANAQRLKGNVMTKPSLNKNSKNAPKTKSIDMRLSEKEVEIIKASADAKGLTMSEFMVQAALRRNVDLHYEMEILDELSDIHHEFKLMHSNIVDHGIVPSEDDQRLLIRRTIQTLLRIEK